MNIYFLLCSASKRRFIPIHSRFPSQTKFWFASIHYMRSYSSTCELQSTKSIFGQFNQKGAQTHEIPSICPTKKFNLARANSAHFTTHIWDHLELISQFNCVNRIRFEKLYCELSLPEIIKLALNVADRTLYESGYKMEWCDSPAWMIQRSAVSSELPRIKKTLQNLVKTLLLEDQAFQHVQRPSLLWSSPRNLL